MYCKLVINGQRLLTKDLHFSGLYYNYSSKSMEIQKFTDNFAGYPLVLFAKKTERQTNERRSKSYPRRVVI